MFFYSGVQAATLEQGELVGEAKAEESSSEESDDEPEQPFGWVAGRNWGSLQHQDGSFVVSWVGDNY